MNGSESAVPIEDFVQALQAQLDRAQRAMHVELGEAEILEGQRGKPSAGRVDRHAPGPHGFQQPFERLAIHQPGFRFNRRLALPD